jgi:hypothetical protein
VLHRNLPTPAAHIAGAEADRESQFASIHDGDWLLAIACVARIISQLSRRVTDARNISRKKILANLGGGLFVLASNL